MDARAESATIVSVLQQIARTRGDDPAYAEAIEGGRAGAWLTFGELDRSARAVGAELVRRGASGDCVLILCPEGTEYVTALLGCLYAGAVAVPAHAPSRTGLARASGRIQAVIAATDARWALVASQLIEASGDALSRVLGAARVIDLGSARAGLAPSMSGPEPAQPAILQYTSGSSARPKGVLISHAQLAANLRMGQAAGAMTSESTFVTWLPPYHDMGLIGGILTPLYLGARCLILATEAFIRRPRRWLEVATTARAQVLAGPDFAFDLCVRRIAPAERAGLDLSSVRAAFDGAEPIRARTLERFTEAFAPYGFRREAFVPCYGMAEATLLITAKPPATAPLTRAYLADELERDRAVPSAAPGSSKTRELVSCGVAPEGRVLIVDPRTRRRLAERQVGEIWVQSPSVALGYFNQPEATAETFQAYTADSHEGPFLRTGDLGFLDQGALFVTGRLKDLIIVRGRNHYPQDIERSVQALHPALVQDAGAAFSVEGDEGELLVVVQEFDKRTGADADALLRRIPQLLREEHELTPAAIVLIKRGRMLKTASGKVQRRAVRAAYLAGELEAVARWELARGRGPLPGASPAPSPALPASPGTQTRRVPSRVEQRIADWLRARLAARLGCDAEAIDPREPLARYGVDSLAAAELTEELERWLGRRLPSTISYDNPTIADLARTLAATEADGEPLAAAAGRTPLRAAHDDAAIAIVGMACRFPGANDLHAFWQLLRNGVDAVTEVPRERFPIDALYAPEPGTRGKICSRFGGFVEQIERFDAEFFGVSPHEAARMDPQQRLFLEVAWQALEDAAIAPSSLAGSRSGVFAGVSGSEYALRYGSDLSRIDADYGAGNAASVVANRLSYFLDLKGPSEVIDTACSSALVALARACRSLRERECDAAIAGGVNAVLAPEASVYFSQLGLLARDGRCKAFDARADGFVRSEGAGAIVLKRLRDALADGDRIHAVIEACAVSHAGRSNGLLAPNGPAQQAVLRDALAQAGVRPDQLDYVEAHGVGAPIADAVEARALGAVFGERPQGSPLRVGSAKTNLGHLEAASGMVGVIKLALALAHEELPPTLHLRDLHPDLGLHELPIAIPTVPTPWPRGDRPRLAGVSAFGFGGTHAHLILREPPVPARPSDDAERPRHLLALSARSENALRELAARFAARLREPRAGERMGDLCFTANTGRNHFAFRLAAQAQDREQLRLRLGQHARGESAPELRAGHARPGARPSVGFVFPDAEVAPGAGRELYAQEPRFRQALALCDHLLRRTLERPLLELLYGDVSQEHAALLRRPSHAHAALLALAYAQHEWWRALGVEPDAVYGSGPGEYAAAAAAGALEWEQAIVLGTRRGLVREGLVEGAQRALSVRALRDELASVAFRAPQIPFASASLGGALGANTALDGAHFGRQIYHASPGLDGLPALLAQGCSAYLELAAFGEPSRVGGIRGTWLPVQGAPADALGQVLDSLGALYVAGVAIDWRALDAAHARTKLALPSYPFQRERHWLDFPERSFGPREASERGAVELASNHPLIKRVRIYAAAQSGVAPKEPDEGEGSSETG